MVKSDNINNNKSKMGGRNRSEPAKQTDTKSVMVTDNSYTSVENWTAESGISASADYIG